MISSILREEGFNKCKHLMISNSVQYRKAKKLYNNKHNSTFVSPVYTVTLAGNIIAYTPI